MISWRNAYRNLFIFEWLFPRPRINHILADHIRTASTPGSGMMWEPLTPDHADRPRDWGKEGYFFILNDSTIEVWRCENWEAHMISLSFWDHSKGWE